MKKTQNANELFEKWRKDPEYVQEYEALEEEFSIADALIQARTKANLSQAELASRMHTTQSAIARLEGGSNPSYKMLKRYAEATGTKLSIQFT